ncbi:hypothetical protein [Candidatus Enterococcus clewellii]|uniref:Uncharacterized protein n=1 Tax=Candidatus Enterococcus clewellii TaxID=1834193 RepID=A0A242JWT4_9ENTE|nr:hypothetical protein [Enterococcus sp. 9E7_DIV0242]OTP06742.1 hypothetical protein A5888_004197 [Enterococcus sp. 9E7_DIV0242]
MNIYNDPEILIKLESFTLEEINEGIETLENSIGRTRFGNKYNEQLTILYTLRGHGERKLLNHEINEIKRQILDNLALKFSIREARVKTFQLWIKYHDQRKGNDFVRDKLRLELDRL